jgi:hypothetical protein
MAGRPILRAYLAQVEKVGIQTILNRLAGGESIAAVARAIHTSRQFLSTFLNSTPEGVEALAVAREIAAASGPKSKGSGTHSEMYGWIQDSTRPHLKDWITARLSLTHSGHHGAERASTDHLQALQQLRAERTAAPQHDLTPEPLRLLYTDAATTTSE